MPYGFTLEMLFPMMVYGFANMYVAKVLYSYIIRRIM